MAEIQVERTKKGAGAGWLVGLLLLAVLVGAGWYFTMGPGRETSGVDLTPAGAQPAPRAP